MFQKAGILDSIQIYEIIGGAYCYQRWNHFESFGWRERQWFPSDTKIFILHFNIYWRSHWASETLLNTNKFMKMKIKL